LSTPPASPSAATQPGSLTITDATIFAPGQESRAEVFARRVLRIAELRVLEIDPARATATLRYRRPFGDADVVGRLAEAAAHGEPLDAAALPPWRPDEPVVLHHRTGVVSTFDILHLSRRRLYIRHPALKSEPATAQRIEDALRAAPGVLDVARSGPGATLDVRFDPAVADGRALLRLAETTLLAYPDLPASLTAGHTSFALANTTLGVAAVGEFVASAALPVAAAMLLLSNLGTLRAGAEQAREGKPGLPALYSTIVLATLASGSFFSAALMFWSFRYWERRHRSDMAEENAALLGEVHALPAQARVVTADGKERLVPPLKVEAGQRLRVVAGETIPVDATVVAGAAVIDESLVSAAAGRVARVRGDEVLAGSTVVAGQLDLAALRSGRRTRAAQLAQALLETTVPAPSDWTLTPEAEAFAARTVPPTLAAAAVGLMVGGPAAANAVLRPDYATGIGLAAPLRMLRVNRIAVRQGAIVRTRRALEHLASATWVVLDDHDGIDASECELAELRSSGVPGDQLLPAVAAAAAWLGDERGPALSRACAARGIVARHAPLHDIDDTGVAIEYRHHVVRLRGRGDRALLPPVRVDVDGVEVAALRFHRNGHVPAASTVQQLQRAGLRVFLASGRPAAEAARVARLIGADDHAGLLDDHARGGLLRDLHARDVSVLHVRDGAALPHTRAGYVSVALAGPDGLRHDADVALFGRSLAPLPALVAVARDSAARDREDRVAVLVPNIAAVAGVFALGFTGLTVVLVSNLATYVVHDRARKALADAKANPVVDTDLARGADDAAGNALTPRPIAAPETKQTRVYA